jgi:hypothetical protein
MFQTEAARAGFDASYKIVFKNKGNKMLSGLVTLQFDDNHIDFISSNPMTNDATTNLLTWSYSNLKPFESRSIALLFNINSPTDNPAVNNGDVLNFTAAITPVTGDDLPQDNTFKYNQTVLGLHDPNNIICLQGKIVDPSQIGMYLHYVVNFENTGVSNVENVVVKIEVDTDKYDIHSLQMLNSSHPSSTMISGRTVEFIFKKIFLTAAKGNPKVGGHGDVLFKIKSKNILQKEDVVVKTANIYFDYNFPITTTDFGTVFTTLSNTVFQVDKSISIYPNPVSAVLHIQSNTAIKAIDLYDIQGRVIETTLGNKQSLDLSGRQKGVYFLKITTEKGSKIEKVIKE